MQGPNDVVVECVVYNVIRPDAQPRKFPVSDMNHISKTSPKFYMPARDAQRQARHLQGMQVLIDFDLSRCVGQVLNAFISTDPAYAAYPGAHSLHVTASIDAEKVQKYCEHIHSVEDMRLTTALEYDLTLDRSYVEYEEHPTEGEEEIDFTKTLAFVNSWRISGISLCHMNAFPGCGVLSVDSSIVAGGEE